MVQINVIIKNNIQNNPPSVEIIFPSDGLSITGCILIYGLSNDIDGSIQKVEIKIDNGSWIIANGTTNWNYQWNTTNWENGVHVIFVRSYDSQFYSNIAQINVTLNNIPNLPPIVKITSLLDGAKIDKSTKAIIIEGTASDDIKVIKVQIKIDDGEWEDVIGTTDWTYEWDLIDVPGGVHKISIRASDGKIYSNISQINVTVNDAPDLPPIVKITSLLDGTKIDKSIKSILIEGTASDDKKVIKVQIKIDIGEWQDVEGTSRWTYKLDLTDIPERDHEISVRAFDGNSYSEIDTITIKIIEEPIDREAFKIIYMVPLMLIILIIIGFLFAGKLKSRKKDIDEKIGIKEKETVEEEELKEKEEKEKEEVDEKDEKIEDPEKKKVMEKEKTEDEKVKE